MKEGIIEWLVLILLGPGSALFLTLILAKEFRLLEKSKKTPIYLMRDREFKRSEIAS